MDGLDRLGKRQRAKQLCNIYEYLLMYCTGFSTIEYRGLSWGSYRVRTSGHEGCVGFNYEYISLPCEQMQTFPSFAWCQDLGLTMYSL